MGGGVSVATELLECDTLELAQKALAALEMASKRQSSNRFVIDAVPLWL